MRIFSIILTLCIIIILVSMIWMYWFVGFSDISLSQASSNSNFSLAVIDQTDVQFYPNMRYPNSRISYQISNKCTVYKKDSVERAFLILENKTILDFYSVPNNAEIFIGCEEKSKRQEDFFIAGEGGPVNITRAGDFNVILYGEVLLIRKSECINPNIALHEILHALGFNHSLNSENIMYNVSKCSQTIGGDVPRLINKLYAIPSKPDIVLKSVFSSTHGKYLDANLSIINNGLKFAGASKLNVYADDDLLQSIDIPPLKVGFGMNFNFQNIKFKHSNFEKLRFVIESNFEELDKTNNKIILIVNE